MTWLQHRRIKKVLAQRSLFRFPAPFPSVTCAANLKKRKLLILAARNDNIVPPSMARMLWEASGKQKIVWYDANHYSAALHIADGLEHILKHFQAP